MPELPEVETVRRTLAPHLIGQRVMEVKIFLPKIVRYLNAEKFNEILTGKSFLEINRRGKYLLCHLSEGWTLVVHLGMSGQLIYFFGDPIEFDLENRSFSHRDIESELSKAKFMRHVHVIMQLDKQGFLIYHDIRRFGYLTVCPTVEHLSLKGIRDLGPEPLDDNFKLDILKRQFKTRKGKIKQLLLDQHLVAGIGNIYADEILFNAGIHPLRTGDSLTLKEFKRLYAAIRVILQKGIELNGTSISDYVDGEGWPGSFQEELKVYQREGKPCCNCSSIIERIKLGGRSAYFCPLCQK